MNVVERFGVVMLDIGLLFEYWLPCHHGDSYEQIR